MNKCVYCINKEACDSCDTVWHDQFIPNNDVRKYFSIGYVGVRGMNGYVWEFDTTNEDLIPTHAIKIYNSFYCPYCGERMLSIQSEKTFTTIGYCCICEGARAEIEYEKKLKELNEKFEKKYAQLRNRYSEKLKFDTDKLLSIKHKIESERSYMEINHFTSINGKKIDDIAQM